MTVPNGRANGSAIENPTELVVPTTVPAAAMRPSTGPHFPADQMKKLIADLEVPFDPAVIEWGQVIPDAEPSAYTDRLNSLFTPAGWTRKYTVHTSANFRVPLDSFVDNHMCVPFCRQV